MTHNISLTINEAFAEHLDANRNVLLSFYAMWLIGSHACLPVIATVCLCMSKRPAAMINMCIVWSLTGILYSLLFHAHFLLPGLDLSVVCALQSSLVFACTVACSAAHACFMYEVRSRVKNFCQVKLPTESMTCQIIIISVPYAAFLAFAIPSAVVVLDLYPSLPFDDPTGLSLRRSFYCSVPHGLFSISPGVVAALFLIPALVFKGEIIKDMYMNWKVIRHSLGGPSNLRYAVRMLTVCTYVVIAASLSVLTVVRPTNTLPDTFFASTAVFLVLMFSTGHDIWQAACRLCRFCFCLPSKRPDNVKIITSKGLFCHGETLSV